MNFPPRLSASAILLLLALCPSVPAQEATPTPPAVTSVAGRTGSVTLTSADITDATSAASPNTVVRRDAGKSFEAEGVTLDSLTAARGSLTMSVGAGASNNALGEFNLKRGGVTLFRVKDRSREGLGAQMLIPSMNPNSPALAFMNDPATGIAHHDGLPGTVDIRSRGKLAFRLETDVDASGNPTNTQIQGFGTNRMTLATGTAMVFIAGTRQPQGVGHFEFEGGDAGVEFLCYRFASATGKSCTFATEPGSQAVPLAVVLPPAPTVNGFEVRNSSRAAVFSVGGGGLVTAAGGFAGSGANLTSLNASNLTTGTLPDALFPTTLPAVSGQNLTSLNASNLKGGTLDDARLSPNVVTLAGAQTLSNKTLAAPAIDSFANAAHTHQSAEAGGTLDAAAVASGTFPAARLGAGTADSTTFLRGDGTWSVPASGATVGQGGYYLFPAPYASPSTAGGATLENQVKCARASLPVGVTVNSIHFSVGASSEGGYASVGVYSGDGNTLLIDSGPKSTESAAVLSTTLSAPVTLLAGVSYLFCYTNDNAASAVHTGGDASQVVNGLLNAGGTQIGVASNPSASGQLPATLGSLTAAANTGMPLIKLQN